MRSDFGYYLFKFCGNQIEKFLSYTDYGSRLVFGSNFEDHYFVFKVRSALKMNNASELLIINKIFLQL